MGINGDLHVKAAQWSSGVSQGVLCLCLCTKQITFLKHFLNLFLIGCMWALAGEQHVFRKINSLVRAEALESVCCHFAEFIC